MPMMVVNDDDFNIELQRLAMPVKVVEKEIVHGRNGKRETSELDRKLIAAEAIIGTDIEDIRKKYGISSSSISAYKNGVTSTANYNGPKNNELVKSNNDVKSIISERAEKRILTSLGLLNKDKMLACSARDLSGIAKDLSSIVKNMEPSIVNQQNNQVIIFKPRMKEEDEYEIIDVA